MVKKIDRLSLTLVLESDGRFRMTPGHGLTADAALYMLRTAIKQIENTNNWSKIVGPRGERIPSMQREAICDFSEGIDMLSGIRRCGFTPWIVLDNVPAAMCDHPTKNRHGNTEPPKDSRMWRSYVRQLIEALIHEFGRDEVSNWRFRVGPSPT